MTDYPTVNIDLRHRMLSVRLNDGTIDWTDQLDEAHLVDVDADGHVVALDIMTLDDFKLDEMAERFGFLDQLPAIKAAIYSAMRPRTTASGPGVVVVTGTTVGGVAAHFDTEPDSPSPPLVPPIIA